MTTRTDMTRHHTTRTRATMTAALLLLAGFAAACGDDEEATPTATAAADVTSDAPDVTPATVPVVVEDYAFVGLPARVPAGTGFTLDNTSDTELHELVAIRLPDDEDRSGEALIALPPDQLQALLPEVRTVLLAAPGSDEVIPAVGDGTLTDPGRYLVLCAIPTGADPAEYLAAAATSEGPPDVPGGPPHLVHGMWAELVVD